MAPENPIDVQPGTYEEPPLSANEVAAQLSEKVEESIVGAEPPPTKGPKSLSTKFEQKTAKKKAEKQRQRAEALQKMGIPPDQIMQILAAEEYNSLPLDKKVARLEQMFSQGMSSMAQEMVNLRHNDGVLADALDVNFRAVARALVLAGVDLDKQKEILQQVSGEIEKERAEAEEKRKQAEAAAQKAAAEAHKKSTDQTEATALQVTADKPGEAPSPPEEATTFGG